MVLREVADLRFVSPLDRPLIKGETRLGLIHLDQQRFQQSGLAQTVAAHQADLLAAHHGGAEVLNYRLIPV